MPTPSSPPDTPQNLDHLAGLLGVEPEYIDNWGRRHSPSEATKRAIVQSLRPDLAKLESGEWQRILPPTLVWKFSAGNVMLPVRIPVERTSARLQIEIRNEAAPVAVFLFDLGQLAITRSIEIGGREYVEVPVELPRLPGIGYYDLYASLPGWPVCSMRLILVPDRAWLPEFLEEGGRTAGVAVSLYGVRSSRNWGCGDFTDLENLLAWLKKDVGGSFLALNPLHAIDNRQPYNISPYLPNSTFFRNALYLDLERLPDFSESPAARRLVGSPQFQATLRSLRDSEFVEYEKIWHLKRFCLKLAFRQFLRTQRAAGTEAWRRFERFVEQGGERLHRFAVYCALWDWLHRRNRDLWIWPEWPHCYQRPDTPEVSEFSQKHSRAILFHNYMQWLLDEQLGAVQQKAVELGLPIGLYHDLALATDRCGADLWAYGDFYVPGCRVGAPPDGFAPNGQDWAFPPPNRNRHRENGYQLFIDSIRANARHGGALRIDHVMRLFRLFWIPEGMEAKDGAYVQDYHEDLLGILALESVRNRFLIVGEDLGTVAPNVRQELDRFGILSYKVFYFEKTFDGHFHRPEHYAKQALVASTTHDLATLAGFWTGRDVEARRAAGLLPDESSYHQQMEQRRADKQRMLDMLHELGLLPGWVPRDAAVIPELTGELHNAVIGFLVSTPSMLMVLNQEDLTKETEQQNLPASTWQYPNWRRKMKYSVEELSELTVARDFTAMFRHWLIRTGRITH